MRQIKQKTDHFYKFGIMIGDCLALRGVPQVGEPKRIKALADGRLKQKTKPPTSKLGRFSLFCFTPLGLAFIILAVRGGFEPPEPLRVRQFSKLLVSATHPPHQNPAGLAAGSAKIIILFYVQNFE